MASYAPIGNASFSLTQSQNYYPLLSDGDDVVSRTGTVASGIGILKRGQVCKIVPATGVITVGATAAEANCILANDVDATSATVAALVYLSGKFKADAIVWPGALSHADVTDALRNYGILLESVVFTDGTLVKSVPRMEEQSNAVKVVEHNREEGSVVKEGEAPPDAKPSVDSPWAYLTPEEREKHPELADPPTIQELIEAGGEGGEGGGELPDVPPVTISPTSASPAASGGTGSVAVTVTGEGESGTWIATKDSTATWLSFSPATPQTTQSGTVTWTAAANTGAARTAHLYINGKTFTVSQAAA